MKTTITRRQFLGNATTAMLACAAAPLIVPSRLFGQNAPSNTLNIAQIGVGWIGGSHLENILNKKHNHVAMCDVDLRRLHQAHSNPKFRDGLSKTKDYQDYRRLLDDAASFDAVVIGTGCRWHVPLSKAFIKAGKPVYCEKPLARVVAEARDMKEFIRNSKVVTQLGTQGAASEGFRRSVEIIQSGLLGPVREVHLWCNMWGKRAPSHLRPPGEDPVPQGLNWDEWLGPAPYRPYKEGIYHGNCLTFFNWYDFSSAMLAEFGQHNFMLPVRALQLSAPVKVDATVPEPQQETVPSTLKIRYDFAARGAMPPVTLYWYEAGVPVPAEAVAKLKEHYKETPTTGCLFIGDKGTLYADGWGKGGIMRLKNDKNWRGVSNHEAAKTIPKTEPRSGDHFEEWTNACKGQGTTYCPLDRGAEASEVMLPGIVSTRLGAPIEWDGVVLKVRGNPAADQFIHTDYRTKWLV